MTRGTILAALALLAACTAGGPPEPVALSDHRCDNGLALHIAWWPDRAEVAYGTQSWTLPIARSGSGARYADGIHEVWEHQGVVRVTDGTAPPTSCTKDGG